MVSKTLVVGMLLVALLGLASADQVVERLLNKGISGSMCGHRNEGKTCQELGFEGTCCNKFGRCSNDAKSCLKENGCQSGPCKSAEPRFVAEEPKEVVKNEKSDADDDTNVVVKTISVPVPLCKNCPAAAKSEESSEESSEQSEESSKEEIKKKLEKAQEESKALEQGCVKDNGGCPAGFHKEKKEAGAPATSGAPSENSEASEGSESSIAPQRAAEVPQQPAPAPSEESSEESSENAAPQSQAAKEAKEEVKAQEAKVQAVANGNPAVQQAVDSIKQVTSEGEAKAKKIIEDAVKAADSIYKKKQNGFAAKAKTKTVLVDIPSKGPERTSKLSLSLKDRGTEKSLNPIA